MNVLSFIINYMPKFVFQFNKNYTNAYPNQLLYTMEPNMDTVNAAKEAIRAVMNGEESPKDTESNVSSSK